MAVDIKRAGLVTIRIQTFGGSLETLGFSMDMADTTDHAFYHDVPGDLHGGPQGPPIDSQFLGRVIRGRLEMSRWDEDVFKKLQARITSSQAEDVDDADIGKLLFQDTEYIRILLSSANLTRNFPICIMRDAWELPLGTKFSAAVVEFEAHRNQSTGIIYSSSTS